MWFLVTEIIKMVNRVIKEDEKILVVFNNLKGFFKNVKLVYVLFWFCLVVVVWYWYLGSLGFYVSYLFRVDIVYSLKFIFFFLVYVR